MNAPSAIDLQAALQRLDALRDSSENPAQRQFQRYSVRSDARLLPVGPASDAAAICSVHVRDISRGGAGLLASQPVAVGKAWSLQLIDGGVPIATLPAFCRYCRHVINNAYLVGVEFGIEASILMALGIPAKELAHADMPENSRSLAGEFVSPESLLTGEAN